MNGKILISGRVLVSSIGVVGDSGTASPNYYLTRRGPTFERLVADEQEYPTNRLTRAVFRAVRRTTVSEGVMLMSGTMAIDNRELLPPFAPAPRNADGVFGMILRRSHPAGYFAHVPWAIQHEPPTTRAFTDADLVTSVVKPRVCDIVMACLNACHPVATTTPQARLRRLGSALEDIGSLPPADFEELVMANAQRLSDLPRGFIAPERQRAELLGRRRRALR